LGKRDEVYGAKHRVYEDGGKSFKKDSNRNKSQTKATVSRSLQSISDLEDYDEDELNELFK
jgi:hypothetical protein